MAAVCSRFVRFRQERAGVLPHVGGGGVGWQGGAGGKKALRQAQDERSARGTLANGAHQAGPYIPRDFLFSQLPQLNRPEALNPDLIVGLNVDSHDDARAVRVVWYNNRFHGNPKSGRDETRVTGFGGKSSALLNPENTGALTVFAFGRYDEESEVSCHVWVCRNRDEEELVEDQVGPVEPGKGLKWPPQQMDLAPRPRSVRTNCWLSESEIPDEWRRKFPSGLEIIRKSVELRDDSRFAPDERLLRRRACEFEIFRSVEEAFEMPHIVQGFASIDSFVARAQTILQRRKARSGNSLELHAKAIFVEERLVEGRDFAHQPESEPGKKPDFLFPSTTRLMLLSPRKELCEKRDARAMALARRRHKERPPEA